MDTLDAILLIEGDDDVDNDELISAWQYLIDTGLVWKLQGYYGRTAKQLIEVGLCKEGE
jgi:hypothetical protein